MPLCPCCILLPVKDQGKAGEERRGERRGKGSQLQHSASPRALEISPSDCALVSE